MSSIFKYPADMADLNAAAGLDIGSDSRGRVKDLMCMRVLDSSSNAVNPYSNITPSGFVAGGSAPAKASIWLYMPQSINASYSIEYADINLGVIGKGALQGVADGQFSSGDAQQIGQKLKAMAEGMFPEVQMGTIGNAIGIANNGLGLEGGSLSGSDVSALTQKKAFNPYLENVFKGVGFRTHPFNFKFVVRSAAEGVQVKGIIKTLKEAMHPDFSGGGNRFLKIPDLFDIKFVRNSGNLSATNVLYKFKPCVLTSLNVNYTPDGYYAVPGDLLLNEWNDISVSVDISLQFKETQILTKKDFKDTITF